MGKVSKGDVVTLFETLTNGWAKVMLPDNKTVGYCISKYFAEV
ncbi:SH3 domain-containing protein [Christensenellaceae bacterium OttesenSCG-928-L17]|nr:SH3 domain-containing protein [Christensenellaceae bacterium OttesenSCG-928-L17]